MDKKEQKPLPALIRKGRIRQETGLSLWQIDRLINEGVLKAVTVGAQDYVTRGSYLAARETWG
jgi:hypothetical protein